MKTNNNMKTNLNKVELIGYAGTDIKVNEFKKGSKMAHFSLGTHSSFKNKAGEWVNTTVWHRIVLWNENAEKAEKAVRRGKPISITGKLNYRSYETQTGEKRHLVEIIANNLDLVA